MTKIFNTQEIAVVVTAKNYDPKLLSPSFLNLGGILPSKWMLSKQPIVSDRASQLTYDNGVTLAAQPGRFMAIRNLQPETTVEPNIEHIIGQYATSLSQLDFQGVGINIRGYVTFPGGEAEAHQHFFETVFAQGAWQHNGTAPVQAAVNLVYTFDQRRLLLSITEAKLQLPEQAEVPILLFSGNFDYDLSALDEGDRIARLKSVLATMNEDVKTYEDIVHQFLAKADAQANPELAAV